MLERVPVRPVRRSYGKAAHHRFATGGGGIREKGPGRVPFCQQPMRRSEVRGGCPASLLRCRREAGGRKLCGQGDGPRNGTVGTTQGEEPLGMSQTTSAPTARPTPTRSARACPAHGFRTRAPWCSSGPPATSPTASSCRRFTTSPAAATCRPNTPSSASPAATGPTTSSATSSRRCLKGNGDPEFDQLWPQFASHVVFAHGEFDDPRTTKT